MKGVICVYWILLLIVIIITNINLLLEETCGKCIDRSLGSLFALLKPYANANLCEEA